MAQYSRQSKTTAANPADTIAVVTERPEETRVNALTLRCLLVGLVFVVAPRLRVT